ncbi:MAG: hypothetical protein ACREYF_16735 [Gammaproteobacteria bacterium]
MTSFTKLPCDEASVLAAPVSAPCVPAAALWILAATILASSIAFIDGTVANIALPALQCGFDASVFDAQWVIEPFALFLSALLLVGGAGVAWHCTTQGRPNDELPTILQAQSVLEALARCRF